MSEPSPDANAPGTDSELVRLVQQLAAAEAALQAHVAATGSIDAIMNPSGRPVLLAAAQSTLISSEASQRQAAETQAAILNAIPAHIALIDSQGVILVVNESWKQFASANALQNEAFGVGCNYLEVCAHATGDCLEDAAEAGQGLRRVLAGETRKFSLEYACHSPNEKRWFRLMVTPTSQTSRAGAVVMHVDITERHLAEDALRQSELEQRQLARELEAERSRLVAAQSVAKIGSWETDLVTFAVVWSAETHSIYETNPATFRPTHLAFMEQVHPGDRPTVDQAFQQSLGKREAQAIEHRVLLPDKRIKYVEERWQVMFDAQDRPVRAIGTCRDITAQYHAQQAIRLQAEMLDHIGQAVIATDRNGVIVYANRYAGELYGWIPAEMRGRNTIEVTVPQNSQEQAEEILARLQSGESWSGEFLVQTKGGRVFPAFVTTSPLVDQRGERIGIIGISQDITERKQTEEKLREQAALINEAHDAILVRDLDDRIIFWNRGAERLYGWSAAEALGRLGAELLKPELEKFHLARGIVLREGTWTGEILKTARDGTGLTLDVSWTLLRDTEGRPKSILSIDTDITERKKIEQQFLRAQRMESIGTLAGGIAHDLNNLLAPITMGVGLLKLFETHPRSVAVIDNIERSARRGSDLVKQVLSFARGVEGTRVALQMRHNIREIEGIIESTFPKNITVVSTVPKDLWPILADPTQLNQVVLNLCVNARDAMPDGGRLELAAANNEIDEQYAVMNRGVAAGRYVVISVTDSGSGIPREIIDRIFEPFFTTKEHGKGTGLGLSTVMGIVRSHGGFVNVYSEVGKGSTFKVHLPAHTEPGTSDPSGPAEGTLPRGHGELVLVVDDEAPIREITQQTLEAFGYKVVTAEDGARATGLYAQRRTEIAVVLTDMMMPVMDGPALINALRHINPKVRIVAASGLNANANVARAAHAGVKHFIPKPYSADTLLTQIKAALTEPPPTGHTRPPV